MFKSRFRFLFGQFLQILVVILGLDFLALFLFLFTFSFVLWGFLGWRLVAFWLCPAITNSWKNSWKNVIKYRLQLWRQGGEFIWRNVRQSINHWKSWLRPLISHHFDASKYSNKIIKKLQNNLGINYLFRFLLDDLRFLEDFFFFLFILSWSESDPLVEPLLDSLSSEFEKAFSSSSDSSFFDLRIRFGGILKN